MITEMVSIVVPVYQAKDYLADCMESILSQTYGNLEVILVDDGSEDGSGALCEQYAGQYPNVFCFHQRNQGVSGARNRGLDCAKGEYILFVDSDDYIAPDYLEKALLVFGSEKADMYLCGYQGVVGSGKIKRKKCYPMLRNGEWKVRDLNGSLVKAFRTTALHAIGTKIYKRDIIEKYGIRFQGKWNYLEDIYFCLDYLVHCDRIYVQNKVMYYYRWDVAHSLSKQEANIKYGSIRKTFCLLYRLANPEKMGEEDRALFFGLYLEQISLCLNSKIRMEKRYNGKVCGLYKMISKDFRYREALAYAGSREKMEYVFAAGGIYFPAYLVRRYWLKNG